MTGPILILHKDPSDFHPWTPGDPLVVAHVMPRVPREWDDLGKIDQVERIYAACNGFAASCDADLELATAYYSKELRSMSVGDLVVLPIADVWSCQNAGWMRLAVADIDAVLDALRLPTLL